jgi:hypothetical protein
VDECKPLPAAATAAAAGDAGDGACFLRAPHGDDGAAGAMRASGRPECACVGVWGGVSGSGG